MSPTSKQTPYYTLCLNIANKPALVAGGGEVARRKTASLCDCGAKVTVVSPTLDPILEYMVHQQEVSWKPRNFEPSDINGACIVIAATNQREVNRQIAQMAKEKNILCNVVDQPEEGNFIVPSTVERGPLTIAISTSGISPTLAASIRQELEMAYGDEYGLFLEIMSSLRHVVMNEFKSQAARQIVFDRMVASKALSLLRNGMADLAEKELRGIIQDAKQDERIQQADRSLPIMDMK